MLNVIGNNGPGISTSPSTNKNTNTQIKTQPGTSRITAGKGINVNGAINIMGNSGGGIVATGGAVISNFNRGNTYIQNAPGQRTTVVKTTTNKPSW